MARMSVPSFFAAASAFALLAACSGGAENGAEDSAADTPAEIEQRQENFKAIGDSFKAIREQLETDAPDFAVITPAAADINERLQRLPDLFPDGTSVEAGYDTEALATIWEDPEGFAEAIENGVAASADMMAAAATGDPEAVGGQVGNLGLNGCKACHEKYRVDDE
ncbi:cytochrome c [uncultured Erythrobacter sp.]|uniref:c-type cytochrome n=1 Tax=uncultured Erythrobacter sp. TaxID=263913 RepID=UPI00260AFBF7|nr:cytochrome c [uncultured Erythrobacter sp.]